MGHYGAEMGHSSDRLRDTERYYTEKRQRDVSCQTRTEDFLEKSTFKKGDFKKSVVVKFRNGLDKEAIKMYFPYNNGRYPDGPFQILGTWTDDKKQKHVWLITKTGFILSNNWHDCRWFAPVTARESKKFLARLLAEKKRFKSDPFVSWKSWPQRY